MIKQFLFALAILGTLPAQAETPVTEIVQDNDAFHFVIDGEEVARLDKSGLKVHGDIKYSGVVADTGTNPLLDEQKSDQENQSADE